MPNMPKQNKNPLCFVAQLLLIVALPLQANQLLFPLPDPNLHPKLKYMFADADVECAGIPAGYGNYRTLKVALPEGAVLRHIYAQMANYPWVGGNVPCRSEQQTSAMWTNCPPVKGECGISWSKVRNLNVQAVAGRQVVTADFYNWKHDNTRRARLLVFYTQ